MTATEIQNIARRLANSCWVRYWLHYNYPQESPWLMAISIMGAKEIGDINIELTRLSFEYMAGDGFPLWVIPRTNEDGAPFQM